MSTWKNTTSYSRGDKERVPRSWSVELGRFRLSVHRYHGCDGWFASCEPLFRNRELSAGSDDKRKIEAIRWFRTHLNDALMETVEAWPA